MENMESILTSTKKLCNMAEENTDFDADVITHINATFAILRRLGAGPKEGFSITDEGAYWTDFLPAGPVLEMVKSYMYAKVRLIFDPPTSTMAYNALVASIAEYEWSINAEADSAYQNGGG